MGSVSENRFHCVTVETNGWLDLVKSFFRNISRKPGKRLATSSSSDTGNIYEILHRNAALYSTRRITRQNA